MANAVFMTKANPVYDDLPEFRYHFPKTYLNQAQQAVGDWIVYYEPRREGRELSGRAGRQCYFAVAKLDRIDEDPVRKDYYYAFMSGYLEFLNPVPFRDGDNYFESALQKDDGSTNRGRFGRSVRLIPLSDFQAICRLGFVGTEISLDSGESTVVSEPQLEWDRPLVTRLVQRPFREQAFGRVVSSAYGKTCAMTGLRILNVKGLAEIEAAHIKPVDKKGPDSPRNGIALSRTIHWMFDEGILSVAEDGTILSASKLVPDKVRGLLNPDGKIYLPAAEKWRPHPAFLRYHRDFVYKGN